MSSVEYQRKYRKAHRAKAKVASARWYAANRERALIAAKKRYWADRFRILAGNKKWREANPEVGRAAKLRKAFGLSLSDYATMYDTQLGRCAACGCGETARTRVGKCRSLSVDHCHETGTVRHLLCSRCNTAFGLLGEDEDKILKLAAYASMVKRPGAPVVQ